MHDRFLGTIAAGALGLFAVAFLMNVLSSYFNITWRNGAGSTIAPAAVVDAPTSAGNSSSAAPLSSGLHVVSYVVDGDTLDVVEDGHAVRVRLLGINAPESVDPSTPVQCYGPEASQHLKDLVMGSWVTLETDPSQGLVDKYGRHLVYVFRDGVNIDEEMLSDGYAREYTYATPYKYQAIFRAAAADAARAGRGLWSACPTQ